MNNKDKFNYARDFFAGRNPQIHPMFVKPSKALKKYADSPDIYMEMDDETLTYTPEEVE
jgi:hypothetical protein